MIINRFKTQKTYIQKQIVLNRENNGNNPHIAIVVESFNLLLEDKNVYLMEQTHRTAEPKRQRTDAISQSVKYWLRAYGYDISANDLSKIYINARLKVDPAHMRNI